MGLTIVWIDYLYYFMFENMKGFVYCNSKDRGTKIVFVID